MSNLRLPVDATHAFCESVHAQALSPWHIRKLTAMGPKFGGGADTTALCGRVVAWDLNVRMTEHHFGHACKGCVAEYRKEQKP